MRKRLLTGMCLLAVVLFVGCGSKETAATMHLVQTRGTVGVQDEKEKEVSLVENLGLYNGYQVGTKAESYAWIDLDQVKLAKMDQESRIEIQKSEDEKELEIFVESGGMFFDVKEPLLEDESMDIHTSNMIAGIRGTCGWIERYTDYSRLGLLEGVVECQAPDGKTVSIGAGQMAVLADGDSEIQVFPLYRNQVPAFVEEEAPELTAGLLDAADEGPQAETNGESQAADTGERYYDPEAGLPLPEFVPDGIERRVIEVKDGQELIDLIWNEDLSNTEIHLGDGTYETMGLGIYNVENLSIIGTGKTRLVTMSGYEEILSAVNCKNLQLYGLVMGHELLPQESGCSAGVVYLSGCEDAKLTGCDIYGCGLIGISGMDTSLTAKNTVIRDCSDQAVFWMGGTGELRFEDCAFSGNGARPLFGGTADNTTFTLENCIIEDNAADEKYNFYNGTDAAWTESGTREAGNGWQ